MMSFPTSVDMQAIGQRSAAPAYTIAYVASAIHSGSTLLDLLLGTHPSAIGVGEVATMHSFANMLRTETRETPDGNQCTCGAKTIWDCSFWTQVNSVLVERCGLSLREVDLSADRGDVFASHNRALFDAVALVSGARVIIDSSKSTDRLQRLLDANIAPMLPIHLVRDPRGQYHSLRKRRWHGIVDVARRYNRHFLRTRRIVAGKPHIRVRYEALTTAPETSLRRIAERLGLSFAPEQLEWTSRQHHNIGGNRMRINGLSEIKLDDAWKQSVSWPRKCALSLLTLPTCLDWSTEK